MEALAMTLPVPTPSCCSLMPGATFLREAQP